MGGFVMIVLRPWIHAFDFRGRSRRLELLIFHLLVWGAVVGILRFDVSFFDEPAGSLMSALSVLLVALIPAAALTVRRFHDCDRPGWFVVLGLLFPIVFILMTLYAAFQGSEGGENSYGPDPREPKAPNAGELGDVFS